MTVPNLLSIVRLVLVPVYAVLYFSDMENANLIAGLLLIASTMTDALDGWIARRFNQISDLGKILDPLADKLTQFSVMLCLVTRHKELAPLVAYIVFKEGIMLSLSIPFLAKRVSVYPARWFGKVATFAMFFFSVCFTLFPDTFAGTPMRLIAAVLIAMLAVALFGYGITFIRQLKAAQYDHELEKLASAQFGC